MDRDRVLATGDADQQNRAGRSRVPRSELAIGAGAILGVTARWLIGMLLPLAQTGFPLATLITNLLGCLLIGVLQALFLELVPVRRELQLFLVVGLLGSFTTFSTFSVETVQLIQSGQIETALLYQALSLAGGLILALTSRSLAYMAHRRWLARL